MKNLLFFILKIIFGCCICNICGIYAQEDRILTVVGSKHIRPNNDYQISVLSKGFKSPELMRISINGTEIDGRIFVDSKDVTIIGDSTQNIFFNVKNLRDGRYKLDVKSLTDVNFFDQSHDISVNRKNHLILTQTDKSIYKPGDVVHFKVIVLDMNLRPVAMSKLNIYVNDGDNNVIKEYLNVESVKGVYQNQLQLSDSPVMGSWKIRVKLNSNTMEDKDDFMKFFDVMEYILPKYEVIVESKPHVSFGEEKIRVKIEAKYENGENVKGEVTLSVYPILWLGSVQPFINNNLVRKVARVDDGSAIFIDFDIRNELNILGDYERFVNIEAIFEEDLTLRTQNSSAQVSIHKYNYNLEIIKVSENFKPGLPYYAIAKVENFDGTPVNDRNNPIIIFPSFSLHEPSSADTRKYYLDSNGLAEIEIQVPPKTNQFSLKAQYLDSEFFLGPIESSKALGNDFIQLQSHTKIPKINDEISLEVKSTQPMDSITYFIFGKNDLIVSKTLGVPGTTSFSFKILTSIAMLPHSSIVVYSIRPDGEILSDKIEIKFHNDLQNSVEIDTSIERTEPGRPVSLTIRTKPNSYIGLSAVDEHIAKLNEKSELTYERIYSELMVKPESNFIDHIPAFPTFESAESFMLTNAKGEKRKYLYDRSPLTKDENDEKYSTIRTDIGPPNAFKFRTKPPLAGPYAFSRIPKPRWENPRLYLKNFASDTWFTEEIQSSGYDGRTTVTRKTPLENSKSWMISGFSVDPIYGLGVTRQLTKVNVFKNFFISTRIPHSLKVGELLSIPVTVFNNFNNTLKAEVIFHKSDGDFMIVDEKDQNKIFETADKKDMLLQPMSQATVSFIIRPVRAGKIKVKFSSISNIAVDEIEEVLMIEHEGAARTQKKVMFINLRNTPEFTENVTFSVPMYNVIPQSIKIEVSSQNNFFDLIIKKLESSVKALSQSNAEQNALAMICYCHLLENSPNLRDVNSNERKTVEDQLEIRYQSQLNFKRSDGSFSMFGKSDKYGNLWMTALSARALQMSSKHIHIEENIVKKAYEFLSNIQSNDGSFSEFGEIYNAEAEKEIPLTAFILTSILSSNNYKSIHRNTINKAVDYLIRNLNEIQGNYQLALCAYAIQLVRHSARDAFFTKLDQKATTINGSKYWENGTPEMNPKHPWFNLTNSLNIETTAYALLTFTEGNLFVDATPIFKWLIEHENDFKDTSHLSLPRVIAIEAFTKMLPQFSTNANNVVTTLKYNDTNINLSGFQNSNYEVPSTTKSVEINARGQGFGLVQFSYNYNSNVTAELPRFTLDPQVNRLSTKHFLHLTICTSYVPDNYSTNSNGAVMEVNFPSGFVFDKETIPFLKATEKIRRVYTKKQDTVAVVFFESLEKREICPVFKAHRIHRTADLKPASVIIYDHVDNSRRALQFYRAVRLDVCDLCTDKECLEREPCTGNSRAQKQISSTNNDESLKVTKSDAKGSSHRLIIGSMLWFMLSSLLIINNNNY